MSQPTFKSPCERLRFRAMRDGEGSDSDRAWRQHAAECKECQASLHLMELLRESADLKDAKLPHKNLEELMQRVSLRYGQKGMHDRHHAAFGILWRVAVVACIVFLAGRFVSLEWVLERSVGTVAESIALSKTATPAEKPQQETLAVASSGELSDFEEYLPMGTQMEESIEDVRSQIDYQFNELNELIDHDLNEY